MVRAVYYEQSGTIHYNVKFKAGGLLNRLVALEVRGLKPSDVEWVYLVEAKRQQFLTSRSVLKTTLLEAA